MDFGGFNWALLKFVGPLVLVAVIVWAVLHNRMSRRREQESERATHQVYDEEERMHRHESDDVP